MMESEEKSHHRLPLPLLKLKDEALDDMEEKKEEEAPPAGQQSEEDSKDEDDTADFPDAL